MRDMKPITINGKTYARIEDLPPELRAVYARMTAAVGGAGLGRDSRDGNSATSMAESNASAAVQRMRQRIEALPAPIRAQVQRLLEKFPADQIDALLGSGSPLIERALQRAESSVASRQTGPAHPAQNATHTSSSSTELLNRLASTRVQTVVAGDHPGAGMWLLVAAVCALVALSYVWLGT